MGIGASVFLIAVGAILAFAVTLETEGIDLNAVGWILLIVGAVGALLSLLARGRTGIRGRREEIS